MNSRAPFRTLLAVVAALIFALSVAPQATAGETERDDKKESEPSQRRDQDEARQALLQGKTMPLTAILAIVEKRVKGPVIDVKLETHDGRLVYLVGVLSTEGHKVDLELDARTGEVLKKRNR